MMRRTDQQLTKEYKKDTTFEQILSSLNECLFQEQKSLLQDRGHLFPTLHILGAPRSGTTLVSQVLASHLPIGYINNLVAAFWKAPIYGIELSKKLLSGGYKSIFDSNFGRTDGIREPHEFGYFWNHHLKYGGLQQLTKSHESAIDWKQLALILNNMAYHFNAPVAFKSFLFGFHAAKAVEHLPKACFIYIKRDFLDNAFSILKLRKRLNGRETEWGSIKPIQYEQLRSLTVYEQITGQILCMEHEYLLQLDEIPEQNKAFFYYEDICDHPTRFLNSVSQQLAYHYPDFSTGSVVVEPFEVRAIYRDRNNKDIINQFLAAKDRVRELFPYLREVGSSR